MPVVADERQLGRRARLRREVHDDGREQDRHDRRPEELLRLRQTERAIACAPSGSRRGTRRSPNPTAANSKRETRGREVAGSVNRGREVRRRTSRSAMTMPPIVGVPIFSMCVCGPSSRIRCPQPHTRNAWIAMGVPSSVTASANAAATRIETSPQRLRQPLEPGDARPLEQHQVAGPRRPPHVVERLIGVLVARDVVRLDALAERRRRRSGARTRRPRSVDPRGSVPPARRSARAPWPRSDRARPWCRAPR